MKLITLADMLSFLCISLLLPLRSGTFSYSTDEECTIIFNRCR